MEEPPPPPPPPMPKEVPPTPPPELQKAKAGGLWPKEEEKTEEAPPTPAPPTPPAPEPVKEEPAQPTPPLIDLSVSDEKPAAEEKPAAAPEAPRVFHRAQTTVVEAAKPTAPPPPAAAVLQQFQPAQPEIIRQQPPTRVQRSETAPANMLAAVSAPSSSSQPNDDASSRLHARRGAVDNGPGAAFAAFLIAADTPSTIQCFTDLLASTNTPPNAGRAMLETLREKLLPTSSGARRSFLSSSRSGRRVARMPHRPPPRRRAVPCSSALSWEAALSAYDARSSSPCLGTRYSRSSSVRPSHGSMCCTYGIGSRMISPSWASKPSTRASSLRPTMPMSAPHSFSTRSLRSLYCWAFRFV